MSSRPATRERAPLALQLALLALAGLLSVATSPVHPHRVCHIRQATTVPAPAPLQRPPRFEAGTVEAGVESLATTWARAKRSLAGQELDLYGARAQLGGYLVFSFQRWLSLGASFEVAPPGSEVRVLSGPLGPPPDAAGGGGLQVGFHFRLSRRCRLDWVSDFWLYGQPTRMRYQGSEQVGSYGSADALCPAPDAGAASTSDETFTMFVLRSQLSLGVDFGRVRLVAAIGLRNVPHHITGGEASWSAMGLFHREAHTIYPYLWLGAALQLAEGLSATVGLLQPLWGDPMAYAPGVGIGLHVVPGDDPGGRR